MDHHISSTDLVRLAEASPTTVREAAAVWADAADPDPAFADDLDAVNAADEPPEDPWAS